MRDPAKKPSDPASGATAPTDRNAPNPGDRPDVGGDVGTDESVAGEEDPGAALDMDIGTPAPRPAPRGDKA